jgi:hypothetical protein
MRTTARFLIALASSMTLPLVDTSVAAAVSPPITRQAAAANAAFLAYAPPPAGGARALCLVDTGVDATPDTAPGLVSATASTARSTRPSQAVPATASSARGRS